MEAVMGQSEVVWSEITVTEVNWPMMEGDWIRRSENPSNSLGLSWLMSRTRVELDRVTELVPTIQGPEFRELSLMMREVVKVTTVQVSGKRSW